MFCRQITINLNKKDEIINVRPLGDIHIGNLGCDIKEFERSLDWVSKEEDRFTIGMGDYIDNVMAYAQGGIDKRWNPETVDRTTLTTEEQTDRFVELWSKIKTPSKSRAWTGSGINKKPLYHKTFGFLAGNHEWKTINQRRFIKDFCEPLNIEYLGRLAYVNVSFKYNNKHIRDYLILALHGGYSGMQAGGSMNRMKAICGDFDCDVVFMGHNHDTVCRPILRMGYDKRTNSPVEKKVILGNTGTFLRGYEKGVDSYVEINPKEAKRVGTITITFEPYQGKMFAHD